MEEQKTVVFKPGSYIYVEGDEDVNEIYIIEKGEVNLNYSNSNIKPHKETLSSGDIFGFISNLIDRPRMESAIAISETSLLSVNRQNFLRLMQNNSSIAIKVINYFADELRSYDERMFSIENRIGSVESITDLFDQGKFYYKLGSYDLALYSLVKFVNYNKEHPKIKEATSTINELKKSGTKTPSEPLTEGLYKEYKDKQIIFCENEPGDELFIIKSGKVKILKNNNESEIMLSILKEGDIFGELAIVSNKPRNATAISFGNTKLISINRNSLLKLLTKSPELLKRIYTAISQRIWFSYLRLESRLYKNPLTKVYSFLENKLLEENVSLKSGSPHSFNFGIDELMKMTGLVQNKTGNATDFLFKDPNLRFNFGQTIIEKPIAIASQSRYFKARDNLHTEEKTNILEENENTEKSEREIQENNLTDEKKKHDLISEEPKNENVEKSQFMNELDDFIKKQDV